MNPRLTQRLYPRPDGTLRQQRIFRDSSVQAALDQVLASLPADSNAVLVRGRVDSDTVATVVAAKGKDSRWSVALLADYERATQDLGLEFAVRYSWPD